MKSLTLQYKVCASCFNFALRIRLYIAPSSKLTAMPQKLIQESAQTGNDTSKPVAYPSYWELLLKCLAPYSSLTGRAIASSSAAAGTAIEAVTANSNVEVAQSAATPSSTIVSPVKKSTKKDNEISTPSKAVVRLVEHFAESSNPGEESEVSNLKMQVDSLGVKFDTLEAKIQ